MEPANEEILPTQPSFRFRDKLNLGWGTAKRLEKISFGSIVLLVLFEASHLLVSSFQALALPPALYFAIQNLLLLIGAVALVVHAYKRLGEYASRITEVRRECDDIVAELRRQHEIQRRQKDKQLIAFRNNALNRRKIVCTSVHAMAHLTRDILIQARTSREEYSSARLTGVLVKICNIIASVFDSFYKEEFECNFHVTIKALLDRNTIVTLARGDWIRERIPPEFDVGRTWSLKENTAFSRLEARYETAFASDNLLRLPSYKNQSADWQNRYTASMVVPIRRSAIDKQGRFELVGYICIGCKPGKAGHIFCTRGRPDEALKNLLLCFADNLYALLKKGTISQGLSEPPDVFLFDAENAIFIRELHENYVKQKWEDVHSGMDA